MEGIVFFNPLRVLLENIKIWCKNEVIICLLLPTLKNVINTWEVEKGRIMRARNVVIPPFKIAGPRFVRAVYTFSSLEPEN